MIMRVRVEFLGLHYAIPKSHLEVEFPGETIAHLINHLSKGMKEFRDAVLKADGSLDEAVQVGLNEEEWVTPDRVNETKIRDGDRITFMMMAGGG